MLEECRTNAGNYLWDASSLEAQVHIILAASCVARLDDLAVFSS